MNFATFTLVPVVITRCNGREYLKEERCFLLKVTNTLVPLKALKFRQWDLAEQGRRGDLAELLTLIVKLIQDVKDDGIFESCVSHDSLCH